jgi:hypothetical protein
LISSDFGLRMYSPVLYASRKSRVSDQVGYSVPRISTKAEAPIHRPTTTQGLILSALSSSASKYLIRPAAEWKPSFFLFFAMNLGCSIAGFTI